MTVFIKNVIYIINEQKTCTLESREEVHKTCIKTQRTLDKPVYNFIFIFLFQKKILRAFSSNDLPYKFFILFNILTSSSRMFKTISLIVFNVFKK